MPVRSRPAVRSVAHLICTVDTDRRVPLLPSATGDSCARGARSMVDRHHVLICDIAEAYVLDAYWSGSTFRPQVRGLVLVGVRG